MNPFRSATESAADSYSKTNGKALLEPVNQTLLPQTWKARIHTMLILIQIFHLIMDTTGFDIDDILFLLHGHLHGHLLREIALEKITYSNCWHFISI